MAWVLSGSQQLENVRRFYFDTDGHPKDRRRVFVDADLTLIRRHNIPLQDLPVLCRGLLAVDSDVESITFTEAAMLECVKARNEATDERARKRREQSAKAARHLRPAGAASDTEEA